MVRSAPVREGFYSNDLGGMLTDCKPLEGIVIPITKHLTTQVDRYNALASQQQSLSDLLDEAVQTILETIAVKEELAKQQTVILHVPFSPASVREVLTEEIQKRLESGSIETPLHEVDLSSRSMSTSRNLPTSSLRAQSLDVSKGRP